MAPGALKWDPRGRRAPMPLGRVRRGAGLASRAKLLHSPRIWLQAPLSTALQTGGQDAAARVCHTYRKVSLMAARSRGSSEVALWGFSQILASAARLS